MPVIEIHNLWRRYGEVEALKGIDLQVEKGELFGLIGPDGAGKTSLIRILATLLKPSEGEAWVLGKHVVKDFRWLRSRIGYMPGRFSLYQDLSVEENLELFATIFGTTIEENYELIRDIYVQIEPFKKRKAGALSGGMKQKLALCCALIHAPEVILLDEPTTGVDAVSRREFWDMLDRLKERGISMLVSTPYMDEASRCDRVALIQQGNILQVDRPEAIEAAFPRPLFAIQHTDAHHLLRMLRQKPEHLSVFAFGDSIHYTDQRAEISQEQLARELQATGLKDVQVRQIAPTIEDCFMELMTQ
jgi:ABC-2 type transport system ATP-binding protein